MHVRVHTFVHFGPQFDFCLLHHRALESNQYNHITATYFLLAERMLRERQDKEQHSQTRSPSPSKAQFRYTHTPAHIHKHFLRQTECCLCSAAYCQFTQNKSDRGWTDGALFFQQGLKDTLRIEERMQISNTVRDVLPEISCNRTKAASFYFLFWETESNIEDLTVKLHYTSKIKRILYNSVKILSKWD